MLDCILNMDQGKLLVAVTNLNDAYLEMDVSEYLPTDVSTPMWMQMLEDPALYEALPTEEELDSLLTKYWGIVMDDLDDVEKSEKPVKVGQLEQKLTVLETTIDGEDLANAAEDVLKAAAEDAQIKAIIADAVKYLEQKDAFGGPVDADEIYKEFQDSIEEALDSLEETGAEDMDGELVLTEYVNGSHQVVGYGLEADGEEVFRYLELRDGGKLAFELDIPDTLEITGEGTEKNGAVTADYIVSVNYPEYDEETFEATYKKMDVLKVSLVDFKAEGETVNGKIRIAPTSDLLQTLGLSSAASSAIDLASLQLELGLAATKSGGTMDINVLSGEDLLAGLSFTVAEKEATAITEPANTCDMEDIEAWLEDIDVEKLVKALDDAGLPASEFIYGVSADTAA